MKWGLPWGLQWGWIEKLIQLARVKVKLIRNKYYPCVNCRNYHGCAIPRRKHSPGSTYHSSFRNLKRNRVHAFAEDIFDCEKYEKKT